MAVSPCLTAVECEAADRRERLAFVARGFEAILLRQLLQPLQEPLFVPDDEPLSGELSAGGFDELGLLALSEFLAQSGQGIGLARWLYRYWTGEELPARSSESFPGPVRFSGEAAWDSAPPAERGERIRSALRPYWSAIVEAATAAGLSPHLVGAVVWAESAGNPQAVSRAGAQGLMQLMPATARELGVTDPFDPEQNLQAGSRYLRQMLDRFRSLPLALAAYNAGPGRVERSGGVPPIAETRAYVRRVLELYHRLESEATAAQAPR